MHSLQPRLDALASRGALLRTISGPLFLLGIFSFILSMVAVWPSPGATGYLPRTAMLAPPEIAAILKQAGVATSARSASVMSPADSSTRLMFGILPVVLWLLWRISGFVLKSPLWRGVILFFTWPFILSFCGQFVVDERRVPIVGVGHISERGGERITSPPQGYSGIESRNIRTAAYRLSPDGMPSLIADQARFVLAQQAYHDRAPERVRAHLHDLSNTWRPQDTVTQTTLGVLAGYARAHGGDPGTVAKALANGHPKVGVRSFIASWTARIGVALIILGLILEFLGNKRIRTSKRLQKAVDDGLPDSVALDTPNAPGAATIGAFGQRRSST